MATMDTSSLLDHPEMTEETLRLYEQIFKSSGENGMQELMKPAYHVVTPIPDFCLKTKNENKEKVFINICKAPNVPDAKDITDEELVKLLDSDDPSGFRIPMSLGEPHAEVDKSGVGCTAYDVVVNSGFLTRVHKSQLLMGFFLTLSLEGLENKYNVTLDRNWVILKNRKHVGSLAEQNIRKESKPWIMEMDGTPSHSVGEKNRTSKPLISEVSSKETEPQKSKAPEPEYVILQEPPEGVAEFYVAEIHLPKVKSAASLELDVGEDRILLQTRSNVYHLDIWLPQNIVQEECGAQFNRQTKILTLTMQVQAPS